MPSPEGQKAIEPYLEQLADGVPDPTVALLREHIGELETLPRLLDLRAALADALHCRAAERYAAARAATYRTFNVSPRLDTRETVQISKAVAEAVYDALSCEPDEAERPAPTVLDMLEGMARAAYLGGEAQILTERIVPTDGQVAEERIRLLLGPLPWQRLREEAAGHWGAVRALDDLFDGEGYVTVEGGSGYRDLSEALGRRQWRDLIRNEVYDWAHDDGCTWGKEKISPGKCWRHHATRTRAAGIRGEVRYKLARLIRERTTQLHWPDAVKRQREQAEQAAKTASAVTVVLDALGLHS